jgi:hypothetical protein
MLLGSGAAVRLFSVLFGPHGRCAAMDDWPAAPRTQVRGLFSVCFFMIAPSLWMDGAVAAAAFLVIPSAGRHYPLPRVEGLLFIGKEVGLWSTSLPGCAPPVR